MITSGLRQNVTFFLNGVRFDVSGDDCFMMFADWLRKRQGLVGTKIVCAEGDCGACTVLRSPPAPDGSDEMIAVNSCIALVAQLDGASVVTVEGMACGGRLSPAQEAMRICHGSQCGYCTPGFVMAISGMLEKHDAVSAKTAANYLTGNLCRCTGYQPIVEAASTAAPSEEHRLKRRYLTPEVTQELTSVCQTGLKVEGTGVSLFAPISLADALKSLASGHGQSNGQSNGQLIRQLKILGAATDLGVQYNKGKDMPAEFLSLHLIKELECIYTENGRITVGARTTLTQLHDFCETAAPEFSRLLNIFASPQIKNAATLVGNIANGSPIGDTMPYLLVCDCNVHVAAWDGAKISTRQVALKEFYTGYRQLALKPHELITHVSFEATIDSMQRYLKVYKVSARKDLDISAVSAAFHFRFDASRPEPKITDVRISLGGVAATPIRATTVEVALLGKPLNQSVLEDASLRLAESVRPLSDARGSAAYRKVLVKNLFAKYARDLLAQLAAGSEVGS